MVAILLEPLIDLPPISFPLVYFSFLRGVDVDGEQSEAVLFLIEVSVVGFCGEIVPSF